MLAAGVPSARASLEAALSGGRRARVPGHGSPPVGAAGSSPGEATESPESSRRRSGEPSWGQKRCSGSSGWNHTALLPALRPPLPFRAEGLSSVVAAPGAGARGGSSLASESRFPVGNGEGRKCSSGGCCEGSRQ